MSYTTKISVVSILLAGLCLAPAQPAGARDDTAPIAPGLWVATDPPSGRNVVWIELGTDLLAVDATPPTGSERHDPRFVFSTAPDRGGSWPSAVRLQPSSRSDDQRLGSEAEIRVQTGFTLGGAGREVVVYDLARRSSRSDAVLWLPAEKMLVTGPLCDRGRVAASRETDTQAWIAALEELMDLEPAVIVPASGPPAGPELLREQVDRISDLRDAAESTLQAGGTADDVPGRIDAPWFTTWRSEDPEAASAAVRAVFEEVGGLQTPWVLLEDRWLQEGPSPTRDDPAWTRPQKVLWRNSWPDRVPLLAAVAPGVEIVVFDDTVGALANVADADALIGTANHELLAAGEHLRWVQVGSAGVERYLEIPQLASGAVVLTNGQRLASEVIGEHVMALTRALARGLNRAVAAQSQGLWQRHEIGDNAPLTKLRGKTLLVVGLGGIGTEVARLADGAGIRVTAIRNSRRSGPDFVDRVGLGEDLPAYLAEADVVVNCLPLTDDTRGLFDAELFATMKPTAFFINVGRGGTVVTADLIAALEGGTIAGAGLDVTDPEPLPEGHPLWKAPNLIITPHFAAWSDADPELRWLLYRENLRRFVAGEPLLSVVDPEAGY